jgi:adenylate kinase
MNLIILGPQGSGKGTQAKILSDKLGLYYFEMGGFLRDLSIRNTEVASFISRGILVPDDLFFLSMKALMEDKILKGNGMILDGFPRTMVQYQTLKNWFDENGLKIDKMILLEIDDDEVVRRLSARRTCEKCGALYNLVTSPIPKDPQKCDKCGGTLTQRTDDNPETIKKRLSEYRENTVPLLEQAQKDGVLIKIDGEQAIEKVTEAVLAALN